MAVPSLKVITIGDGAVGKSAILQRYVFPEREFLTEYTPTIFDEHAMTVTSNRGKRFELTLIDSAGQEDFRDMMQVVFNDTDIFILCFDCAEPNSFMNIRLSWMNLLKNVEWSSEKSDLTKREIVLVMTKTDLMEDQNKINDLQTRSPPQRPVQREEGERLAREIEAFRFVCCSSLRNEGIQDVFDAVLQAAEKRLKTNCCIS